MNDFSSKESIRKEALEEFNSKEEVVASPSEQEELCSALEISPEAQDTGKFLVINNG